ncbi:tetratricopeptide repeat protein [Endozoicomonas lisbonensis]|uniref:TPR repeat protein n=1 Tax=Endozoicomonas lisbonensis TaxID=3120522 RepID=A0ABV2SDH9_9GAMM
MSIKTQCQCGVFAGLMLFSMAGVSSDFQQLMEKAGSGDQAAILEAGISLLQRQERPDSDQAEALLQPLADNGNTQAQLWLGRAYRDGLGGIGKDINRSFRYFELAGGREGMNPEAQMELGRAYMNGEGTDRNLIAAYMWTALSAEQQGSWTSKAIKQRKALQDRLTSAQLEKAKELVEQLHSIYLKQP